MAKMVLTLITGRSARQGTGISTGKARAEYREATGKIELNPLDMARSGLKDGDHVMLKSEFGAVEVTCHPGGVPEGLAFMAFGPACNRLVGGETHASGMPDSKHIEIECQGVPGRS